MYFGVVWSTKGYDTEIGVLWKITVNWRGSIHLWDYDKLKGNSGDQDELGVL